MKVEVVTTFSEKCYRHFGRRFVDSFLNHDPRTKLICYHESQPSVGEFGDLLEWRNLDHDEDRKAFIAAHGSDPLKVGGPYDPNSQAIRFCHKVFAVTDAARRSDAEWLVWMDADVEMTATPDWGSVLPTSASLAFLSREPLYTECGFVGYRLTDPKVRLMLEDMRLYYTSGEIFTRPRSDWHDSRCFDICRFRSDIPKAKQHSLCPPFRVGWLMHVWPYSALAKFATHNKGPERKATVYGEASLEALY